MKDVRHATQRRTIYVDLDDVLCETARGCLAIVEREFGRRVPYDRLSHFDLGRSFDLAPEETATLYRIVHEPDELLRLDPIGEALSVLHEWARAGFELAIVTGRPPATHEASLEWLKRHGVPYDRFVMVDKYGRFGSDGAGAIALRDLAAEKFCWAVEDSGPVAEFLADRLQVRVALYDRPWNRRGTEHPLIRRYRSWGDIRAAFWNAF